jgi:hypothetical protein
MKKFDKELDKELDDMEFSIKSRDYNEKEIMLNLSEQFGLEYDNYTKKGKDRMEDNGVVDLLYLGWNFLGVVFVCSWMTWSFLTFGNESGSLTGFITFIGGLL